MNDAWFALLGTLGGVLITGTISLAAVALNHKWQAELAAVDERRAQSRIHRDDKLKAYPEYLNHVRQLHLVLEGLKPLGLRDGEPAFLLSAAFGPDFAAALNAYNATSGLVQLLAGQEVTDCMAAQEALLTECMRLRAFGPPTGDIPSLRDTEQRTLGAMRAEVGTDPAGLPQLRLPPT